MCGIAGYRLFDTACDVAEHDLRRAVEALAHRGPDDVGHWIDSDPGVGLGFRRLSILDLSPLGHQPMLSDCGAWAMVYNGEVYNFRAIRKELEGRGRQFRSAGDSEVVLAAFAEWGLDALDRFVGMFAIALWHMPSRTLYLVRDRLGVKPLHYYWNGTRLYFGSELKALRQFTGWTPEIDCEVLGDFFRYGYIADPWCIYRDVHKLPPGHHATLSSDGSLETARYWAPSIGTDGAEHRSEDDLAEELEALLIEAFAMRLVSDVPVGVFLSGGIDSSIVTALLRKRGVPIKTFTIGFDAAAYDESPYARAVASHLGTDHHARSVHQDDAKRVLSRWADLYDEPFGDESGIPTFLISEFAAEHVTVALSADGGDELFSGYNSYTTALARLRRVESIPARLRGVARRSVDLAALVAPKEGRIHRLQRQLQARAPGQVFDDAVSLMSREDVAALLSTEPRARLSADEFEGEPGERFCAWDLQHYLPGDVLTKVDRATMAVSLEGREPLLDHRIVEFAFSLPFTLRRGTLGSKHLLKQVLFEHIPRELVDRPKRGFAVPLTDWLVSDLHQFAQDALDATSLAESGVLQPEIVGTWMAGLDRGDPVARRRIWLLVAFQLWHRKWMAR